MHSLVRSFFIAFRVCRNFSNILVGLCHKNFPLSGLHVGERANSFGIYTGGNIWMEGKRRGYASGFDNGDVVGCGMAMAPAGRAECKLFFTKNGALLGSWISSRRIFQFSRILNNNFIGQPTPATLHGKELFPTVLLQRSGCKIEGIFDVDEFKYDLRKHLSRHWRGNMNEGFADDEW